MIQNRVVSLLVAVMAILLLQEQADADGSDPLSLMAEVSESLFMCPVGEELSYEPFDSMTENSQTLLLSSAYAAVHSSGSLRFSQVRRVLTSSQGGRNLVVQSLLPHFFAWLHSWMRRYNNISKRGVRFYISLCNLRI